MLSDEEMLFSSSVAKKEKVKGRSNKREAKKGFV